METERNILAAGCEECERVARKMRRVSESFDPVWAPGEFPKGVRAKVEELTSGYERLETVLSRCCTYMSENWRWLENNKVALNAVQMFLEAYKELRTEVLILDDSCIADRQREAEVFGQRRTAMEYVYLVGCTDRELQFVLKYLENIYNEKPAKVSSYRDMARKMQPFASGLSDYDYENLVERHEAPLLKGTWVGRKCDATYFGQWFGLECKLMNAAFVFYDERKTECKLHYKHNDANGVGLADPIHKLLKDFPKK